MSTLIEDQADIVKGIYRNYEIRQDKEKLTLLLNATLRLGIMFGKEITYANMKKNAQKTRNYSRRAKQKSHKILSELEFEDGEDERTFECESVHEARKKRDRLRSYARYHDIPVKVFMDRREVIVEKRD
jgi:hypothetical protein